MVPKYPAARARINRNGSDSSGSEISCDTGQMNIPEALLSNVTCCTLLFIFTSVMSLVKDDLLTFFKSPVHHKR